jgi:diamine N-acetyltransferase
MPVIVRVATAADVPALGALLAESHAFHADALPGRFRPQTGVEAEQRAHDVIPASGGDGALFVAEEDGAVIGAIRLSAHAVAPTPSLTARRYVFVQELVVAAYHHRRGIGRALMAPAERWAEERGIAEIELNVFGFNRAAIAFYEALGYTAVQYRMWRRSR